MKRIKGLINKFTKTDAVNTETAENNISSGPSRQMKNWYAERYDSIVVQRNVMFIFLLILLFLSILSIGMIAYVLNTKRFDPFVIQIDDTTGMAKIVNPISSTVLSGNEALAQYFIKKYVIARETYNPVDFSTEARKVVRLLSTNSVYWNYRGYLRNEEVNPDVIYGQKNTTYLLSKSWSKISESKYMFRFSINETSGSRRVFNKIAVIEFQYVPMELTESEKEINPVGFQVTGYRVDDDNS
jgi:type IV secretion system protein VirB8